jgi:hypothetical protein
MSRHAGMQKRAASDPLVEVTDDPVARSSYVYVLGGRIDLQMTKPLDRKTISQTCSNMVMVHCMPRASKLWSKMMDA